MHCWMLSIPVHGISETQNFVELLAVFGKSWISWKTGAHGFENLDLTGPVQWDFTIRI